MAAFSLGAETKDEFGTAARKRNEFERCLREVKGESVHRWIRLNILFVKTLACIRCYVLLSRRQ